MSNLGKSPSQVVLYATPPVYGKVTVWCTGWKVQIQRLALYYISLLCGPKSKKDQPLLTLELKVCIHMYFYSYTAKTVHVYTRLKRSVALIDIRTLVKAFCHIITRIGGQTLENITFRNIWWAALYNYKNAVDIF